MIARTSVFELNARTQDNIVVADDRRALLCDFGCSRIAYGNRSLANATTTTKGTICFWAPELLNFDRPVRQSKETDVWAFGMSIYVSLAASSYLDELTLVLRS